MLEPELWKWAEAVVASLDEHGRPTSSGRDPAPGNPGGVTMARRGAKESSVGENAVGVTELGAVYRAEYLHAIEMARATNDPCENWGAFVEELWSGLVSAFGLDAEVLDASEPGQRLDGLQGPSE